MFELLAYMSRYRVVWKENKTAATARTAWSTISIKYTTRLKMWLLTLHDGDMLLSNVLASFNYPQNRGRRRHETFADLRSRQQCIKL